MVVTASVDRAAVGRPRDRLRRAAFVFWIKHTLPQSEGFLLPVLTTLSVVVGVLAHLHVLWAQPSMVTLPLLLGGFMLRFTTQLALFGVSALVVVVDALTSHPACPNPGTILFIGATAVIVLVMSRGRVRLGVRGTRGESMLFDLRERLLAQGRVPQLPPGWNLELAMLSAGGQSFAGDFLIAARTEASGEPGGSPGMLQLGLVDVSGKGLQAGARALLLSGALGGLLGSVPAAGFLAAANRYLLRQSWEEGFATAVHVVVDLATGEYECYSAGHPPIAQLAAGSGRWELRETPGPVLGVMADALYEPTRGRLEWGDGLMLFTDGLIEQPGQDLAVGLDRLLGAAGTLQTKGFGGGAARIVDAVAGKANDDRALVLLWRSRAVPGRRVAGARPGGRRIPRQARSRDRDRQPDGEAGS
jgi:hypothetical protein